MKKIFILFVFLVYVTQANAADSVKGADAKVVIDAFSIGENQTKVLEKELLADSIKNFESYKADVAESGGKVDGCVSEYYNTTLPSVIKSSLEKNKFREVLEKMYIDGFSSVLGEQELSKLATFFSNEKVAKAMKSGVEPTDLDPETQKLSDEIEKSGIGDKFYKKLAEILANGGKNNPELKTAAVQAAYDMSMNKEEAAKACPNLSKIEN